MLKIDIDAFDAGWVVALAKSVLTTDGSAPPPPNPGAVPVPGAVWLFGSAIAAFAGYRRKLSV